jgi:hypothetical protein
MHHTPLSNCPNEHTVAQGPRRRGVVALGFTLLELSIALALVTAAVIFSLQFYRNQALQDQALIVAKQYKKLNAAIGTYMTVYYYELRNIPADCSILALMAGSTPTVTPPIAGCEVTLPQLDQQLTPIAGAVGLRIANGLQPTLAELVSLGILSQETTDIPAFSHHNVVFNANGVFEPFRFAFLIDHACIGPPRNPLPLGTPPCAGTNKDLRTLVFNTQPYFSPNVANAARQTHWLGEVMVKAGADAAMSTSITPRPGELYGHKASWQLPNPIRTGNGQGLVNMVGMMNGFGASGFLQFTRRDGSLLPTDHWNFNKKNLHDVARLESAEGDFGDKLAIPYKELGTACATDRKVEEINQNDGINGKQDGIAFDRKNKALLICDDGKWLHSRGKGAANWNDYIDVKLSANAPGGPPGNISRATGVILTVGPESQALPTVTQLPALPSWPATTGVNLDLGLDANQWGMPTVLEATTRGYRQWVEDSWCFFAMGPVQTGVVGGALVGVVTASAVATWGVPTTFGVFSGGGGPGVGAGGGVVAGAGLGLAETFCVDKNSQHTPVAQKPEYQLSVDPSSRNWVLRTDMHHGGELTVRFHKLYQ